MRYVSRSVREEAGLQDLNRKDVTPAEAWECAACLSAARDDAELAAWFSLHKEALLTPSFRLFARLAISVLGPRADALRRMLPAGTAPYYLFDEDPKTKSSPCSSCSQRIIQKRRSGGCPSGCSAVSR